MTPEEFVSKLPITATEESDTLIDELAAALNGYTVVEIGEILEPAMK